MATTLPPDQPPLLADLLRLPFLGHLLHSPHGRLLFQIPLALVAFVLIYDGFTGRPMAAQNLATVGVWVHYRGLVVLALLLAGNLFCMGCPFTLPRTLAHRLANRGRRWPLRLRNKWIAIAGLWLMFFLYEWLDLWASPLLTAWVIVAYFVASFVLEVLFKESAFCKYVCPLGTFNFVYSATSPLHIRAKQLTVCRTCVGHECINGSYASPPITIVEARVEGQPIRQHLHTPHGVLGCGTLLYVPQLKSNLDCTLCLDCARACPHDNVALAVRSPLREITDLTAWPKRWDIGFLLISLAFMGLMNAFGMIPPVYRLLTKVGDLISIRSEAALIGGLLLVGMLILPALAGLLTAWLSVKLGGSQRPNALRLTFTSFAPACVPLGLGIWAAHYSFHFLTGALTILPITQQFLLDHGLNLFGQPNWSLGPLLPLDVVNWIEVGLLLLGYGVSVVVARRIAGQLYQRPRAAYRAWLPWAVLLLAMLLFMAWVMSQPMEMRGTLFA